MIAEDRLDMLCHDESQEVCEVALRVRAARDLHIALKILEAQGTPDREEALQRRDDRCANTARRVWLEAKLVALNGGGS